MSADPITSLEVRQQQRSRARPPAAPATRAEPPRFEAVGEGRYRFTVPAAGLTLELDFLRREAHQLKGELLVRCDLPGAMTHNGVLSIGDLNISSTRTRQSHAKYLAERARAKDLDFVGVLEEFAQRVLAAEREGQPATLLGSLPRPAPEEDLNLEGLRLQPRHPVFLFGDGGSSKSYLSLWIAGCLAQRGRNVGFFDWELAGEDHRDRLERLFGASMPAILYARCTRPLAFEADRLRRIVRDEDLDFAVFDSVAFACDGPPESAEVAGRYFQALRQLGELGSLHVAHVTKNGETSDHKPFGSVFWHNGARGSWNVKAADPVPGSNILQVALHNRKANLGPLRPAVGFELVFHDGRTVVRRVDVGDVPDLAAGLTVRQRMAMTLRRGSLSPEALADEVGADAETVRRTARRHKDQFVLLDGGRMSLLERRS